MGNVLTFTPDQLEDASNATQLQIQLDFARPVHQPVKQLLHWSLEEIRNIYAPFRKRKGSPMLTRSEFLRFVRLSRISAFHIFDQLSKQDVINAFEVMSILILSAYTTYTYKIQFMFNVFDLLSSKTLKFTDLILMFKSVVRGFAFLTNQPLPNIALLQKYATTIFSRADLNNDQNLQVSEIMAWVDENKDASELFKRFEPKAYGKEEYHIFNSFTPYKEEEIEMMLNRIKKAHQGEKLQEEDYQILRPLQHLPRGLSRGKENRFYGEKRSSRGSFVIKSKSSASFGLHSSQTTKSFLKTPPANGPPTGWEELGQVGLAKSRTQVGTRFGNIIIIKGKTITKKEVFELKDYFQRLSGGKETILIEDFIQSFSQQKYNHMKSVAASLYNFLDHQQSGQVSFQQLLVRIYPHLTAQHLQLIDYWSQDYTNHFAQKKVTKIRNPQDETKKRVLPRACLPRYRQMFEYYDQGHKGFIDIDDMRRVLGEVCSQREITELFEDSDKDNDGRLTLQEFASVILPSDLEIEGLF